MMDTWVVNQSLLHAFLLQVKVTCDVLQTQQPIHRLAGMSGEMSGVGITPFMGLTIASQHDGPATECCAIQPFLLYVVNTKYIPPSKWSAGSVYFQGTCSAALNVDCLESSVQHCSVDSGGPEISVYSISVLGVRTATALIHPFLP